MSDIHSPEVLLSNLPDVVRQAIGAPMPFPDRHFAVFIIFSWNFPLFWTSLQTYMAAGWGRRVIILDNSPDHRILKDPCEYSPAFCPVTAGDNPCHITEMCRRACQHEYCPSRLILTGPRLPEPGTCLIGLGTCPSQTCMHAVHMARKGQSSALHYDKGPCIHLCCQH